MIERADVVFVVSRAVQNVFDCRSFNRTVMRVSNVHGSISIFGSRERARVWSVKRCFERQVFLETRKTRRELIVDRKHGQPATYFTTDSSTTNPRQRFDFKIVARYSHVNRVWTARRNNRVLRVPPGSARLIEPDESVFLRSAEGNTARVSNSHITVYRAPVRFFRAEGMRISAGPNPGLSRAPRTSGFKLGTIQRVYVYIRVHACLLHINACGS